MAPGILDRPFVWRIVIVVVMSTLVLTAAFVGLLAVLTGSATGIGDRFPVYTLAMSIVFVVSLLVVERRRSGSLAILVTTIGIALAGFVIATLGGEGIIYTVRYPDRVLGSQLVVYFAAAGLICTGLGYWGLKYWRQFAQVQGL